MNIRSYHHFHGSSFHFGQRVNFNHREFLQPIPLRLEETIHAEAVLWRRTLGEHRTQGLHTQLASKHLGSSSTIQIIEQTLRVLVP
jgi:hypothetical protein